MKICELRVSDAFLEMKLCSGLLEEHVGITWLMGKLSNDTDSWSDELTMGMNVKVCPRRHRQVSCSIAEIQWLYKQSIHTIRTESTCCSLRLNWFREFSKVGLNNDCLAGSDYGQKLKSQY